MEVGGGLELDFAVRVHCGVCGSVRAQCALESGI
jgi:hypothetical protein